MRVVHTVNPKIYEDTEQTECLFALSDSTQQVVTDAMQSENSDSRNVAVADGEFTIPLTGITDAKGFFIRSDGDFDLRINGGALIQVRRAATGASTTTTSARVFMEANVTDLKITPQADQRVHWAIWGDPVT